MTPLVVIPARWGSSRLPGKPLIPIAGRTLLSRTVALARRAIANRPATILVATDDDRIAAHARECGVEAVETGAASSGSDRALLAAEQWSGAADHIVNLQGDAPFLPPAAIAAVIAALEAGAEVATPAVPLDWASLDALREHKRHAPFSGTTCIAAADGTALWFSKQIVPAIRDEDARRTIAPLSPVLRHLGLYGYTIDALRRFEAAPPSRYEVLEGLEQLRFLEMGVPVRIVTVEPPTIPIGGIDTAADVALAERLIAERGDPLAPSPAS